MILTNAPGAKSSRTWAGACNVVRCNVASSFDAVRCAVGLFSEAGRENYTCVVLQGNRRADWVYAVLQGYTPFRRPPAVKLDCLWYKPRSRILCTLKKWQRQIEARGVERFYVYASREIAAYSETFGIPEKKFRFIPYHHTLNRLSPSIRDERYIFAGGNFGRDYGTFFRAVEGLPYCVEVACTRIEVLDGLSVPENVRIAGYSHEDYLRKMAGCRINVVPLMAGDLHSGGQQTFLNSMALGKATIVTDPAGAKDYVDNGENGILAPAGDADALRAAMVELMEDHEGRAAMERRAMAVRDTHSTEAYFRRLIGMLQEDLGIALHDDGGAT